LPPSLAKSRENPLDLTQSVVSDLVPQGPHTDSEGLGGAGAIALPMGQGAHDRVTFKRLQIQGSICLVGKTCLFDITPDEVLRGSRLSPKQRTSQSTLKPHRVSRKSLGGHRRNELGIDRRRLSSETPSQTSRNPLAEISLIEWALTERGQDNAAAVEPILKFEIQRAVRCARFEGFARDRHDSRTNVERAKSITKRTLCVFAPFRGLNQNQRPRSAILERSVDAGLGAGASLHLHFTSIEHSTTLCAAGAQTMDGSGKGTSAGPELSFDDKGDIFTCPSPRALELCLHLRVARSQNRVLGKFEGRFILNQGTADRVFEGVDRKRFRQHPSPERSGRIRSSDKPDRAKLIRDGSLVRQGCLSLPVQIDDPNVWRAIRNRSRSRLEIALERRTGRHRVARRHERARKVIPQSAMANDEQDMNPIDGNAPSPIRHPSTLSRTVRQRTARSQAVRNQSLLARPQRASLRP